MSTPSYLWPLNDSPFGLWDRLRLASFVVDPRNRWTQGGQVKTFEQEMAHYIGCKHAVFVSSGSTANTLLAMYLRDRVRSDKRTTVVFPSTTWTTSVSPFIREGFKPHFVDISFDDLAMDMGRLESYLSQHHETTAAVFVTSLLGVSANITFLAALQERYPDVYIWVDNCENTLSTVNGRNASAFLTSTTSTYYGHLLNSGEGGFVLTNSDDIRDYCLMARNHGMTRSVDDPSHYRNPEVDPRFDFHLLGNNFRNTDIAAFIGRMDLAKADFYVERRRKLYCLFVDAEQRGLLLNLSKELGRCNVMFAIPLIIDPQLSLSDDERALYKADIEAYCTDKKIETRPIISGNLLAQRCYRQYGVRTDYPTSEYIHRFGLYVGLYPGLHEDKVRALAGFINEL